jgi:hypothetical protein
MEGVEPQDAKRAASRISTTEPAKPEAKKSRIDAGVAEDESVNRLTRTLSDMTATGQRPSTRPSIRPPTRPQLTEAEQHIQFLEGWAGSMAEDDPAHQQMLAVIAFMRKQFPPSK